MLEKLPDNPHPQVGEYRREHPGQAIPYPIVIIDAAEALLDWPSKDLGHEERRALLRMLVAVTRQVRRLIVRCLLAVTNRPARRRWCWQTGDGMFDRLYLHSAAAFFVLQARC